MPRRPLFAATLALAALALPAAAEANPLDAGATALLGGMPNLLGAFPTPAGSAFLGGPQALDAAGDKVVFASTSDGLFAGDDDTVTNVYVENLTTGAVDLVSRANGPAGEPSHSSCTNPAISDDGTSVAFVCTGPLDPADTNGVPDIYVRNLATGTTTLASVGDDGAIGNAATMTASIDAHGRFVAFASAATNLGGANCEAVYRRDLAAGRTQVVSRATDPAQPAECGDQPSISDDGQRVAFDSGIPLDPLDRNNEGDVYVRDFFGGVRAPATTLVSRLDGVGTVASSRLSDEPQISGDGQRVLFRSFSASLDPADPDTDADVYSRRLDTGRTALFGPNQTAAAAPLGAGTSATGPALLAVGTRGFDATAEISDGTAAGTHALGGIAAGLVNAGGIDGDGGVAAIGATQGVTGDVQPELASVVLDTVATGALRTVSRPAGGAPFVNEGGSTFSATLSANGRYAAFASTAPAIGGRFGVPRGQLGVYRQDLTTGELLLVSRTSGASGAPLALAARDASLAVPQIDADGNRIAFITRGSGTTSQIELRDVSHGATTAIDTGQDVAGELTISDDGQRIAFDTSAPLAPEDTDQNDDVYLYDLRSHAMTLVDRADGGSGAKLDHAFGAHISGDGHSVAFSGSSQAASPDEVFVRNVDAGTTKLASAASSGLPADDDAFQPSISRDGSRVAFLSGAPALGAPAGQTEAFVRDLKAGTLVLASRADGAGGAPAGGAGVRPENLVLSADGQHLAFAAGSPSALAPGAPADSVARVYVRDLARGGTQLVSRRNGAAGAPSDALSRTVEPLSITAAGECVAFQGSTALATPPGTGSFTLAFVRALQAGCGPSTLSRLSFTHARFHVGGRTGGTTLRFTLDKATSVTLAFDRLLPGRRAKKRKGAKAGRCSTTLRHGARCTIVRHVGRSVLTPAKALGAANAVKLSGRVGRHLLVPGRYRLTVTPLKGASHAISFTVVKAPKPKHAHRKPAKRRHAPKRRPARGHAKRRTTRR